MSVLIQTNVGNIIIDIFPDAGETGMNFIKLCKHGLYNGCTFHSIEKGFMIQGGDIHGTDQGGISAFELAGKKVHTAKKASTRKHDERGLVGSILQGGSLTSLFYITLSSRSSSLDIRPLIPFGKVYQGHDTLEKMENVLTLKNHRPFRNLRMLHVHVLDDPYPPLPIDNPYPVWKRNDNGKLEMDECPTLPNENGMDHRAEIAKGHATVLKMLGDIASVEDRPMENVLFIAKLNPITSASDIRLIFSRFGPIRDVHIVHKDGNSLGYGFIHFEDTQDAESAYVKMDGTLIDHRRIRVDFSQSTKKHGL